MTSNKRVPFFLISKTPLFIVITLAKFFWSAHMKKKKKKYFPPIQNPLTQWCWIDENYSVWLNVVIKLKSVWFHRYVIFISSEHLYDFLR